MLKPPPQQCQDAWLFTDVIFRDLGIAAATEKLWLERNVDVILRCLSLFHIFLHSPQKISRFLTSNPMRPRYDPVAAPNCRRMAQMLFMAYADSFIEVSSTLVTPRMILFFVQTQVHIYIYISKNILYISFVDSLPIESSVIFYWQIARVHVVGHWLPLGTGQFATQLKVG